MDDFIFSVGEGVRINESDIYGINRSNTISSIIISRVRNTYFKTNVYEVQYDKEGIAILIESKMRPLRLLHLKQKIT